MKISEGILFYNYSNNRMDIRFNDNTTYGGLHCGTTMEVRINGDWIPTRIEMGNDWYLVGIKVDQIEGLKVRV